MFFQAFQPSGIISDFVEWYLVFEDDGDLKNVSMAIVPNGVSEIAFHFGAPVRSYINYPGEIKSAYIYGSHNRLGVFAASGNIKCLCVMFKPCGACRIFGIPQMEMHNYAVELDELCWSDGKRVTEKVIAAASHEERIRAVDQFLIRQFKRTKDSVIKICHTVSLIQKNNGVIRIKDLGRKLQTGIKTLERRFKDTLGLNPKEYASIVRLNHVYQLVRGRKDIDVQDIVYKCGCYDQSHFINDVKWFAGLKTGDLVAAADEHVIYVNRMYAC